MQRGERDFSFHHVCAICGERVNAGHTFVSFGIPDVGLQAIGRWGHWRCLITTRETTTIMRGTDILSRVGYTT